nr:hypothetical protein [Tanacetum cinerariifolium]
TYLTEQDAQSLLIESEDTSYDSEQIDRNDEDVDLAKERELLASLISKLKCEIDETKNRNTLLETSNKVLVEKLKSEIADFKTKNKSLTEANNKLPEPEWQRFVTLVKQSQELKHVSYHKLYDIMKQHQHEDNSPRIHRNAGYEGQRSGTVAGARDTVGSSMVQKSGIQCYNSKEYGHIARE